jgi:putative spermidine/putrescine transport system substrate-binding protein
MRIRTGLALRGTAAVAVAAAFTLSSGILPTHRAEAATSTIYFTSLGDTNLVDLYRNTVIPDFQKAFPQYTVHFTDILHGTNAQGLVIDNLVAAQKAGKTGVNYDIFEDQPLTYQYPAGKTYKDYFLPLSTTDIPNAAKVPPVVEAQGLGYAVAYRASAVTLAYNSRKISSPPKTYMDLINWIKANPGQFTYCLPQDGGTGDAFIASALEMYTDPKALTKPFNKAAEKNWPKAWALLKSIEPDLYQGGFNPNGNTPVLNLLAKGSISMGTAWSDQGLSALDQGLLPKYIKLTQITPPFAGGPSFISIPKLAQNPAGAKALLNFILSPTEQGRIAVAIEGFPAIDFKYISPAVVKHFGSIVSGYGYWPGGLWDQDLVTQWKNNVPAS